MAAPLRLSFPRPLRGLPLHGSGIAHVPRGPDEQRPPAQLVGRRPRVHACECQRSPSQLQGRHRVPIWGPPALPSARRALAPTNLIMAGWYSNPCNISGASLCVADVGRVFPSAQSAPRVPDRPGVMQVDGWRDLACAASNDKVLTSTGVYDITACDVLDEGLDVLFSHGFIFHRHNSIPYWKYWLLISLSIVLVRFLSYNVQTLWDATAAGAQGPTRPPLLLDRHHHNRPAGWGCHIRDRRRPAVLLVHPGVHLPVHWHTRLAGIFHHGPRAGRASSS